MICRGGCTSRSRNGASVCSESSPSWIARTWSYWQLICEPRSAASSRSLRAVALEKTVIAEMEAPHHEQQNTPMMVVLELFARAEGNRLSPSDLMISSTSSAGSEQE